MDADKIKSFFVHHVEKMILVLVIGGAAYLMYAGMQLEDFQKKNDPTQLATKAQRVKSDIDIDHNETVMKERQPTFDIVKETIRVDTPVDYTDYAPPRTWSGKSPNSIVRRSDPDLLAPESLIVKPVVTAIAKRGSQTDDAAYDLAFLEPAEPVERIEKKKPRERRSRRRGGGMMMEEMGMGDSGMEEMMGMEVEMEADMMGDMMGGMGGGATGSAGPTRRFNSKFDFGMRPKATEDKANPEPAIGWFIAGTAVVPHKKLHENYRLAFKDADQYDARRDAPVYYDLRVQRADVTDQPVEQLTDADWQTIWDRKLYTLLAARAWSGFAPEIVPGDYRHDALSTWIPPVLLDDYRSFALHPLIPMLSKSDLKRAAVDDDDPTLAIEKFSMEDDDTGLVAPGQAGGGANMMMGMDDYGDMGSEDYGGGMDGMMGMGMAMLGSGAAEIDPVDYKLVRFYDFAGYAKSPKFGRKYVYRVSYAVNDPNFPYTSSLQPKVSSLAPDVAQRVQALMDDARKSNLRKFRRWSEWSAPTEPVSLPSLEQYFAGPVDPGTVNTWKVQGKDVRYSRDPPKAKLVASQYDLKTGARIPMQLDITEGTVLSHKTESTDVVDPITLEVKKMPDAELVSGTTVVDLDGGIPLKITDGLKTPGMMLIYDQMGQLRVSTEVGDQEQYRVYSYADERGE